MSRHTLRRRGLAHVASIAFMVFIALAVLTYAQGQDEQFRRGLDALENKQFQSAATLMREAIKQRGQEATTRVGVNPILRTGGTEYLPYYFLGEALLGIGDCSGAVNAWAMSEQQGAVQKSRPQYLQRLRSGYLECEKKGVLPPGKLEPALARTLQLINEVNALATTVSALGKANIEIWRSESNQDRYDRASADLQAANDRYLAARTSRMQRDLTDAAEAVERARPVLVSLESGVRAAIDNVRSAQALVRDVTESISLAEALNTAVESKKVAFTPSMTAALQDGRDLVGRAHQRLSEGQKTSNAPALRDARALAVDAQNRFRQILEEMARVDKETLQRQIGEALTRTQETFSLLDSAVATLARFSSERPNVLPPDKVAERDSVLREVGLARRRLDAARKADNVAGITAAAQLASDARDKLTLLIGAFGPLTLRDRGVHAQLEQGAGLFLKGEYQQAVAALGDTKNLEAEVPLRLHFHLFKAAALYELFLRTRETDQGLRAQALAEVERCKAIDSALQPDARAFSPRFLSFYQSVSAPASAATAAAPQGVDAPGAGDATSGVRR